MGLKENFGLTGPTLVGISPDVLVDIAFEKSAVFPTSVSEEVGTRVTSYLTKALRNTVAFETVLARFQGLNTLLVWCTYVFLASKSRLDSAMASWSSRFFDVGLLLTALKAFSELAVGGMNAAKLNSSSMFSKDVAAVVPMFFNLRAENCVRDGSARWNAV